MKMTLNDHEATLFFPLLGRAIESGKPNPIFYDPLAVEVVEKIDYDFHKIKSGLSGYENNLYPVRAYRFAGITREFISAHPEATVINLGAGLDTNFYIVDDGKIRWINIDSAEVIYLRETLLPANERVTNLIGNVLDPELLDRVNIDTPKPLFVASGLLVYLAEDEIKELFKRIADQFPSSAIVFDRISTYTVQYIQAGLDQSNLSDAKVK
jgi:O-methyltransferase involved in polyketide biosynthesis